MYEVDEGHDFTATKGVNMFLLFESLTIANGDFVFKVWYNKVDGGGEAQPRRPDYPPGWVDPYNAENTVEEEKPNETTEGGDGTKTTDKEGEGETTGEDTVGCEAGELNCPSDSDNVETIGGGSGGTSTGSETDNGGTTSGESGDVTENT